MQQNPQNADETRQPSQEASAIEQPAGAEDSRDSLKAEFMENAKKYHDGYEETPASEGEEQEEGTGEDTEPEKAPPPKSQEVKAAKAEKSEKKDESSSNKRIRELVAQKNALQQKLKKYEDKKEESELSVKEQVELAQIDAERARIEEEHKSTLKSYTDSIGDKGLDFEDNYDYYVPEFNARCPALLEEIVNQGGELYPYLLDKFMEALNNGDESLESWEKLPKPAVKARIGKIIAKINDFVNNPSKYLSAEQMREFDPSYNPPAAAAPSAKPVSKPASIVPKQTKPQANPQYSDGSYFSKLIHDKLNS